MKTALLIVGHGSKSLDAVNAFEKLVAFIKEKKRYEIVTGAHMELAEPGITETVDEIAKQDPEMIVIAPYFLYEGMHIKKDIPEMIEEMRIKYPGIKFKFAKPIGFEPMLADIILKRAAEAEKEV